MQNEGFPDSIYLAAGSEPVNRLYGAFSMRLHEPEQKKTQMIQAEITDFVIAWCKEQDDTASYLPVGHAAFLI